MVAVSLKKIKTDEKNGLNSCETISTGNLRIFFEKEGKVKKRKTKNRTSLNEFSLKNNEATYKKSGESGETHFKTSRFIS